MIHGVENFAFVEVNAAADQAFDGECTGILRMHQIGRGLFLRLHGQIHSARGIYRRLVCLEWRAAFPQGEEIEQQLHMQPLADVGKGEFRAAGLVVHDAHVLFAVRRRIYVHTVDDACQGDLGPVVQGQTQCGDALGFSHRQLKRRRYKPALGKFLHDGVQKNEHMAAQSREQIRQPVIVIGDPEPPHVVRDEPVRERLCLCLRDRIGSPGAFPEKLL